MISREKKILRIAQGFLAKGMSLERWNRIVAAHGVDLAVNDPWQVVSDETLDQIIAEIAAVVAAAKAKISQAGESQKEAFDPLDLYWPGEGLRKEV